MLNRDGEVHAFGLLRRTDYDADDRALLVEQGATGVAGMDGRLSLNRRRSPKNSVRIPPLIVRSNLRREALAEGPEEVLSARRATGGRAQLFAADRSIHCPDC